MESFEQIVKSIEEIILGNHLPNEKQCADYLSGAKQLNQQTHVKIHLGFDSMDQFEFGMYLEDKYNIHIPDGEMISAHTIGDYAVLVEKKLSCENQL
jgi:acyl carrier protein